MTCVCISNDNKYAFTGSKDCSIIKCKFKQKKKKINLNQFVYILGCLLTGKKLHLIRRIAKTDNTNERAPVIGHFDHILAITISTDGQFLVKRFSEERENY